ncbi:MAG TPA: FKBP-type peptidyl-prolyl cis-trans isomerase [Candidatus Nanoarchaeia archaeon]|nr:FKBP-type peptidyl-prolyl cis-trans isomerase [Candidatus Nanoarchaeia archaeon]
MATIKKNDFIELEYTGSLKGENAIFDTTKEDVARAHNVLRQNQKYGPLVVCVGEHFLLKGLDEFLVGKEIGVEYSVDLAADEAFGKKNAKLIQMIPLSKFSQSQVRPSPGLSINVDGNIGSVKTVSGGRVMVDFNHPLAGRDLSYQFKALSIVTDEKRQVDAYLKHLGLDELKSKTENGTITLSMHSKINEAIEKEFEKKIKAVIPSIKEVKFEVDEAKSAHGKKDAHGRDPSHPHFGHDHSGDHHDQHGASHEGHKH